MPNIKLSKDQVYDIRQKHSDGMKTNQLTELYNVEKTTINNILTGKTHKSVGGPISKPARRLNKKIANNIRKKYEAGHINAKLAKKYKVDTGTIHAIVYNKTYTGQPKKRGRKISLISWYMDKNLDSWQYHTRQEQLIQETDDHWITRTNGVEEKIPKTVWSEYQKETSAIIESEEILLPKI